MMNMKEALCLVELLVHLTFTYIIYAIELFLVGQMLKVLILPISTTCCLCWSPEYELVLLIHADSVPLCFLLLNFATLAPDN